MCYTINGDNMRALITGASSGIGRDFAIKLDSLGYEVILVARSKTKLEEVKEKCSKATIEVLDVGKIEDCKKLFNKYKDIDILINNAGFGLFSEFNKSNLDTELNMIDVNIKAVHVLTKLYLNEMIKKDSGRIVNVASIAAFFPGPLMSTYYGTKAYVFRLTTAIFEELRRNKSNVKVHVLCPGPVDTNFNNIANVTFGLKSLTSKYVTDYAVDKMFKDKLVIIPGFANKLGYIGSRCMFLKPILKMVYNTQKKKGE